VTPDSPGLEKNSLVECEITGLALGGRGVARQDGLVLFVERGLPGQRVLARVERVKKRFAEARAEQVLRPSPQQAEPFCPHFGTCGGCLFQDLDYAEQLRWKSGWVADSLARIAGVTPPELRPILASPQTRAYRNKMEYAFQGQGQDLVLGLKERGGARVVDITHCGLQIPEGMQIVAAAREFCRDSRVPAWDGRGRGFWRHLVVRTSAQGLLAHLITAHEPRHFKTAEALGRRLKQAVPGLTGFAHSTSNRQAALAAGEQGILVLGQDHLLENLGGLGLKVSANAFFQTNTPAAELLCAEVRDLAGLTGAEVVYDLYCGAGALALALASKAARVYGLEVSEEAVADARENARRNGLEHCEFKAGRVGPKLVRGLPRPEVIVCDPPRAGLDDGALALLQDLTPGRVVAVSCDPATLARDVGRLNPFYELAAVRPVDLFPHTAHVESVALLRRRA
jgi:23S rRNA (uracil1939-C5)-methyltransferase